MKNYRYIYEAGCGKVTVREVTNVDKKNGKTYIHQEWEHQWADGTSSKSSTADTLKEINKSNKLFFDKEKAEDRAKELLKSAQEREEKLANGYISCAYCNKLVEKKNVYRDKVINIKMYGRNGKYFDYCSPKCASYNQMAHEG